MKIIFSFISLLFFQVALMANMGPQGFSLFLNDYFVETGTFSGDSIQKALKVGFSEVRSIEFEKNNYIAALQKFKKRKNVRIIHGDSSVDLWSLIEDIKAPITFWLDAHVFPPKSDVKNCPLLEELEQIGRHPIKTHTILIDDMHCCGQLAFDYLTQEDLKKKIWEINPDYEISYVPGGDQGEYPENVMVATIPKEKR